MFQKKSRQPNFQSLKFKMENYEIIGRIGTGSFGSVTKIRRRSDGRVLVWKEIRYGRM
jgi:NIMA (never in mitosis gene a)-related kinase